MAALMGMSESALDNRVYERKGQEFTAREGLRMQQVSKTTFFAEAVAQESGGTFVKLPAIDHIDNDSLLTKFNELHAELGLLSQRFGEYTKDGELNAREQADLKAIGDEIHKTMEELLAITFRVYCRAPSENIAPINRQGKA